MVFEAGSRRRRYAPCLQPLRLMMPTLVASLAAGIAASSETVSPENTPVQLETVPQYQYASNLRPASELTDNCFNFPEVNFDRKNSIKGKYGSSPHMMMDVGDSAIDFTVHDVDGNEWNLREALETGGGKPVVLIWGMFTCPAFQGMGTSPPWDKCGYWHERELVEDFKDRAIFLHLYAAEPHPTAPGVNFDKGVMVDSYWSTVKQHRSYQDRLDVIERIRELIHPEQAIIPEYLPGNPYSNLIQPVWCSYALGARPAVVISPDGSILYQQTWLQTGLVAHALESFYAGEEVQSEDTNSSKAYRKPSSRNTSVIRGGPRPSENSPGN